MTTAEFLKLSPREQAALVAEKVMGWHPIGDEFDETEFEAFLSANRYTTEIAAAWEVRDVVRDWPFSKRLAFKRALTDCVSKRIGIKTGQLIAPDELVFYVSPEDICLASLKAVGFLTD